MEDRPNCPECGERMIKRMARKGKWEGKWFWGCGRYPNCKGTRNLDEVAESADPDDIVDAKEEDDLSGEDRLFVEWKNDPGLTTDELISKLNPTQRSGLGPHPERYVRSLRQKWINDKDIPKGGAAKVISALETELFELEQKIDGGSTRSEVAELSNLRTSLANVREQRDKYKAEAEKEKDRAEQLEKEMKQYKVRRPKTIILKGPGGKTKKVKANDRHPVYEDVIALASLRKNILITGPSGCGKSFLASQVAKDLNMAFGSINCSAGMSEGHLIGRLLPTGESGKFEYSISEYVKRYEEGGVFCADEIDAADPNVMLIINTSIANDYLAIPNRVNKPQAIRHKDFVFIACANTFGRGNDRLYVGRNQLDEATLDRFRIGTISMDYDDGSAIQEEWEWYEPEIPEDFTEQVSKAEGIESKVCPDVPLRTRLLWYRKQVLQNRMERIVSTRFARDAHDMKSGMKWTDERIDKALFSGWTQDEIILVNPKIKFAKDLK